MKTLYCLLAIVAFALIPPTGATAEDGQFGEAQICRAAVAILAGKDLKMVQIDRLDAGVAHMHYIRPLDQTRRDVRCKLDGDRVDWAYEGAPWQGGRLNDTFKFAIAGNNLQIEHRFGDGSGSSETFTRRQLSAGSDTSADAGAQVVRQGVAQMPPT